MDRSQEPLPTDPGATLRLAREAAGFSLGVMARKAYFSKGYLSKVETGQREATPAVIRRYLAVLGDDVTRRQLLLALLVATTAGAPSPSAEALGRAFEHALDVPKLTDDDWLARLEDYGREYMASLGIGGFQIRIAGDLAQLQTRLDSPVVAAVAAKLLTLYGLTLQSAPIPAGKETPTLRWHLLGVRAADRSGDLATRTWTRGRAAHALMIDGIHQSVATDLAQQAIAISDRTPLVGRLSAQLALALKQSRTGNHEGTLNLLNDARRTFDMVGNDEASDFAFSEWRMNIWVSKLAVRIGNASLAQKARDVVDRSIPATLPRLATDLELDQALLMTRMGDHEGGLARAQEAVAVLPPEARWPSMSLTLQEIKSAGQK